MLLVTFHGGKPPHKSKPQPPAPPVNNVGVFATSGSSIGQCLTLNALADPPGMSPPLSELRGLAWNGGKLYVVNGSKHSSTVLVYKSAGGPQFNQPQVVISSVVVDDGSFTTSIAHPFGLAFRGDDACFVSNQDTNVVSLVNLSGTPGDNGELGTLSSGSQSALLNGKYNSKLFLNGTFVASAVGSLDGVTSPNGGTIPNVSKSDGGLTVVFDTPTSKNPATNKPHNSVRDVLVVGNVLYVCNEPEGTINFYSAQDGTYLGQSEVLHNQDDTSSVAGPTHFALLGNGIWISAGTNLFWMPPLPNAKLVENPVPVSRISIASANPNNWKIGGISFDTSGKTPTAYIPLQSATGGGDKSGGTILSASVVAGKNANAPQLNNVAVFANKLPDTPEFVLHIADAQ